MSNVNKVILIGRLGRDPETRETGGGMVTNLNLATSESWKDKATGERQERTEWHRVAMFGKLAEIAAQYLRKGSLVYVEGRLQTRSYEKNGETRYATDIVANEMRMLGGRQEAAGGDGAGSGRATPQPTATNAATGAGGALAGLEDDIPFSPLPWRCA